MAGLSQHSDAHGTVIEMSVSGIPEFMFDIADIGNIIPEVSANLSAKLVSRASIVC